MARVAKEKQPSYRNCEEAVSAPSGWDAEAPQAIHHTANAQQAEASRPLALGNDLEASRANASNQTHAAARVALVRDSNAVVALALHPYMTMTTREGKQRFVNLAMW